MRQHPRKSAIQIRSPSAFTLVELLVVITIIAILVALLLPAVQVARETARRVQCTNNIKQLALGCLAHENATGQLPTGGWGCAWVGDADRGTDWRQPGGWIYNLLPFIEQQALHDMGAGLTGAAKNAAHGQRSLAPLGTLHCPSRRPAIAYPRSTYHGTPNTVATTTGTRNDYVANGGDHYTNPTSGGPGWPSASGNIWAGPANVADVESPPGKMTANARSTFGDIAKLATGTAYCGSVIRLADVTDGASNTNLLGEKYIDPDEYTTGQDGGDNEGAFIGDNNDTIRWSGETATNYWPPMQDTPGGDYNTRFGSAHTGVFNMAWCDGSVKAINYTINPEVHRRLCNRKDDLTIDPATL